MCPANGRYGIRITHQPILEYFMSNLQSTHSQTLTIIQKEGVDSYAEE
jgi:hypothetical protein